MIYTLVLVILAAVLFALPVRWRRAYFVGLMVCACAVLGVESLGAMLSAPMSTSMSSIYGGVMELGRLEGFFGLSVALCSVSVAIYSYSYLGTRCADGLQMTIHCFAQVLLLAGMAGVLEAGVMQPYRFLLCWELMAVSSFVLLLFENKRREVLRSAIRFFVVMHLSFFMLMLAFGASAMVGMGGFAVWVMFFVGFGIKAALVPMHGWAAATYAHGVGHVCALSSGAMINMGVYGVMAVSAQVDASWWMTIGVVMFAVGAASGMYGIFRALQQKDLRRMLAYSSVENMGIVMLALGAGYIGRAMGAEAMWVVCSGGALLHVLGHGAYKTALFLGSGCVVDAMEGKADMDRMGGLARRMPMVGVMMAVAVMGICAVPGLCGFVSEFTVFSGLFGAVRMGGQVALYGVVGVVVLGGVGAMTMMVFGRAYGMMFLGEPRSCAARDAVMPGLGMVMGGVLPVAAVLVGGVLWWYLVFGDALYVEELEWSMLWICGVAVLVVGVVCGLWWLRRWLLGGRVVGVMPTWGCAYTAPNPRIQYTASSMGRSLADTLSVSETQVGVVDADVLFPVSGLPLNAANSAANIGAKAGISSAKYSFDIRFGLWRAVREIMSVRFWGHLFGRYAARFAMFQTGRTSHYILHALLLLVLVFLLSVFNIM